MPVGRRCVRWDKPEGISLLTVAGRTRRQERERAAQHAAEQPREPQRGRGARDRSVHTWSASWIWAADPGIIPDYGCVFGPS